MPKNTETNNEKIFELIGLPGSGKTYLANRLIKEASMPVCCYPGQVFSGKGIAGRLKAFIFAPLFSIFLFLALAFRRNTKFENFRRLFPVQQSYIIIVRFHFKKPIVIDEGPLHSLYSALYCTEPSFLSDFFLKLVIKYLIKNVREYLFIDSDKADCVQRFSKRYSAISRFSTASSNEDISKFLRDNTYRQLIRFLKDQRLDALISFKTIDEAYKYIKDSDSPPPKSVSSGYSLT